MRIACLTAAIGVEPEPPRYVEPGVDYLCYTDRAGCPGWTTIPAMRFSTDAAFGIRRDAKPPKILSSFICPGYDVYIWCDATHAPAVPPSQLVTLLEGKDLALFRHAIRGTVRAEAEAIKTLGYDYPGCIDRQLAAYAKAGFPDTDLWELACFIKRNTPAMRVLEFRWWEQICMYSSRDQLSLPFVLWSLGIAPTVLPGSVREEGNAFFAKHRQSNHRRTLPSSQIQGPS